MAHQSTVICDLCGKHYMMDDNMDMPPYWFGSQFVIADGEGIIPMHERDIFLHFCSQECLAEYAAGDEVKDRESLVDDSTEEGRPAEGDDHA